MALTDEQWAVLEPLVEACRPQAKVAPQHLRRTVGAILWRHSNGAKWRALPKAEGPSLGSSTRMNPFGAIAISFLFDPCDLQAPLAQFLAMAACEQDPHASEADTSAVRLIRSYEIRTICSHATRMPLSCCSSTRTSSAWR